MYFSTVLRYCCLRWVLIRIYLAWSLWWSQDTNHFSWILGFFSFNFFDGSRVKVFETEAFWRDSGLGEREREIFIRKMKQYSKGKNGIYIFFNSYYFIHTAEGVCGTPNNERVKKKKPETWMRTTDIFGTTFFYHWVYTICLMFSHLKADPVS